MYLQVVDLSQIYGGMNVPRVYRLCTMVCFYGGGHYTTMVIKDGQWYSFDDSRVIKVGHWHDVIKKCEAGKLQPSVLRFEASSPSQSL